MSITRHRQISIGASAIFNCRRTIKEDYFSPDHFLSHAFAGYYYYHVLVETGTRAVPWPHMDLKDWTPGLLIPRNSIIRRSYYSKNPHSDRSNGGAGAYHVDP